MYYSQTLPLAIYAQGEFGKGYSKTAEGLIRYGKNPIVAIIDKENAGKSIQDVVGINSSIPIVSTIAESLKFHPQALLLGTAKAGGKLPNEWRKDIIAALEHGLDIISGLHDFLEDDKQISQIAKTNNRKLIDVRKPPQELKLATASARTVAACTVLTIGTDSSNGKMTTSIELVNALKAAGHKAKFVATGQTGIMIEGDGIALDRVIGDFMAGAAEQLVLQADQESDFVVIEGQGSLLHPAFSGVTLSLLHGSAPKYMILCHRALQNHLSHYRDIAIPALNDVIALYEKIASYIRATKVIGIALNTSGLEDKQAREILKSVKNETGLPVTDPVRYGCQNLVDEIIKLGGRH